ncbi:unnamed protein product [Moneuplotes crassus]|uniref:Uncharacterized protein n=1 Tax=Euplotes crassus TaxID=5936 RepID=A0AAD1X9M8_EUPCR|nr:unnamed protein product [Moneuplotes crassus]
MLSYCYLILESCLLGKTFVDIFLFLRCKLCINKEIRLSNKRKNKLCITFYKLFEVVSDLTDMVLMCKRIKTHLLENRIL